MSRGPNGRIRHCHKGDLDRLAEMEAQEIMERGDPCLIPFVPLMKGGRELFDEAEAFLYTSDLGRSQRSDLLTGMALLSGLIAEDLPRRLLERRRDIVMESVAYEIIKNEGIQQGMLRDAQELVMDAVMERFGKVPPTLEKAILGISSRMALRDLLRKVFRVKTLEEFEALVPTSPAG